MGMPGQALPEEGSRNHDIPRIPQKQNVSELQFRQRFSHPLVMICVCSNKHTVRTASKETTQTVALARQAKRLGWAFDLGRLANHPEMAP